MDKDITASELEQRTKASKPFPTHQIIGDLVDRELELINQAQTQPKSTR